MAFQYFEDVRLSAVVVQFDGTSSTQMTPIGDLSGIQAINDRMHQCLQAELRSAAKR